MKLKYIGPKNEAVKNEAVKAEESGIYGKSSDGRGRSNKF